MIYILLLDAEKTKRSNPEPIALFFQFLKNLII